MPHVFLFSSFFFQLWLFRAETPGGFLIHQSLETQFINSSVNFSGGWRIWLSRSTLNQRPRRRIPPPPSRRKLGTISPRASEDLGPWCRVLHDQGNPIKLGEIHKADLNIQLDKRKSYPILFRVSTKLDYLTGEALDVEEKSVNTSKTQSKNLKETCSDVLQTFFHHD